MLKRIHPVLTWSCGFAVAFPPCRLGSKGEKSWDKDGYKGETAAECTKQQARSSFPGSQMFGPPQESRTPLCTVFTGERNTAALNISHSISSFSLAFLAEHDGPGHGISLWITGISCPGSAASQFLLQPQFPSWWAQEERQPWCVNIKVLFTSDLNIPVLSTFGHESRNEPHTRSWEEN